MALSVSDRKNYQRVKEAVLRAYEQVPEFYRQRFRNWQKDDQQTYSEVARDLVGFFDRWCSSVSVKTYEQLCELMVLEQFKNMVPERLAIFLNEHKVKTAREAAVLADEYNLTHKLVIIARNVGPLRLAVIEMVHLGLDLSRHISVSRTRLSLVIVLKCTFR